MTDHLPREAPPGTTADGMGAARILIVDDEPAIVETLATYLQRIGLSSVRAHNAEDARLKLQDDPLICVVVSDVAMPGKTGLAMAQELLMEREEAAALEVILITGYATTDTAIAAMRAQAFDLIRKPFRLAEIAGTIQRACASALARRERAAREAEIRQRSRIAETERQELVRRLGESETGLQHTRTALERAERARFNLLAIVSHELRSPLIPIIGFADVIASAPGLPEAEAREYARMIHDAGTGLLKLIEVALDVVALQDGQGLAPPMAERVSAVAGRVRDALAAQAVAKKVTIVLDGPAEPRLFGDISRIERALQQLGDNAVKATPEGGGVVIHWEAAGEGHTRVDVLDGGPGMPADVLRQIGTPFLQKDMSLSREWPGAGLGLALALRVVEAHGGELRIGAGPEGGCLASVTLPAAPRPEKKAPEMEDGRPIA
ncbi:ATP-binding protein [Roseococcus sp. YIM B11640]|uniref:hybrid sensor histidine kinase/response regulator n=1 Tax=Roseococcus sp. YIM B11640 TaxID=3133973 RepID=UPI003C7C1D52